MSLKDDIQAEVDRLKELIGAANLKRLQDLVDDIPDSLNDPKADASNLYDHGEETTVVVEDDGTNTRHGDPLARTQEGLVVFLSVPDDADVTFERGEQVDVVLSSVRPRSARGVPMLKYDEREVQD